jgi:hypothetical protein
VQRAGALGALAAALALATAARLPAALESGNALTHVSGAWMALADDLARGTLYRPMEGELGYGGTRFFPVAFAAHALLLRAGGEPLPTGHVLSLAAALGIAAGLCLLGRSLGLSTLAAAAFAALPLAGSATALGLSAVRGDLLPVALQALALAAIARGPSRRAVLAAAALLALAMATKPTAVAGAAAAVCWLALRGERGAALRLGALAGAGAGAILLATDLASGGRFGAVLAACASGGAGLSDVVRAPLRLADLLVREDPGGLLLLAFAAGALAAAAVLRQLPALPALWLGAAVAVTLGVLGSPGTGANHLADLEAASVAALAGCAARAGAAARLARLGAGAAAAAGILLALSIAREDLRTSRLADARRAAAAAAGAGLVLSEDPLVPIVAGERPFLVDAFMLRLVAGRDPAFARPLADALRRGRFGRVILLADPAAKGASGWYERVHLGPEVTAAIRERYELSARAGRYVVLAPRGPPEDAPVPPPFAWRRVRGGG